ncbi:hypothetical protein QR64_14000 [Rhodococcus sp. Chr-9]|nr:hypothetical protein QR64_14000 [Rhodococcus sp. Chr-9]
MDAELDDAPFITAIDALTPRDREELRSLVSALDNFSSSCAREGIVPRGVVDFGSALQYT